MPAQRSQKRKKSPPAGTPKPPSATPRLRIRMYRQGLGDCFLLTFDGTTHVLIDCGVIVGTANPEPLMTRVVEDIRATTSGRVDVLVVTHEHWDHVSGFTQAKAAFDTIEFKEVWFAWTEEPGNPLADRLREEREKKKQALTAAVSRLAETNDRGLRALNDGLVEVLGFAGLGAVGGGDTAKALTYARERGQGNGSDLKFLHPGQPVFSLPGVDRVRIYVLGPPEDEKLLKRSNPSRAHSEVYLTGADAFRLALGSAGEPGLEEAAFPFAPEFRVGARQGKPSSRAPADLRALFARHYLNPAESYRAIEDDWLASAGTLALQLDANTNNTSLVLAFEFIDTGEVFLFPGDAQVGNWLSWDKYTWKIQQPGGASEEVTAQELLARTRFYKVGHHGSHNATLEEKGLERMTHSDLVAMIPVNQEMARKKRWKMPWPKLFERLQEKCSSVILEDEAEQAKAPRGGRIEATSLFVDYQV